MLFLLVLLRGNLFLILAFGLLDLLLGLSLLGKLELLDNLLNIFTLGLGDALNLFALLLLALLGLGLIMKSEELRLSVIRRFHHLKQNFLAVVD